MLKLELTGETYNSLHDELVKAGIHPPLVEVEGDTWRFYFASQDDINAAQTVIDNLDNSILTEQKTVKLQQIAQWTAAAITGGFWSAAVGMPHRYDSDDNDQKNLTMMLQAAQSAGFAVHPVYQGSIPMRVVAEGVQEKAIVQHSAEQMEAVVADLAAHIGHCKQIGWQLQALVSEAMSAEQLAAIVWPVDEVQTYIDPEQLAKAKVWWRRFV